VSSEKDSDINNSLKDLLQSGKSIFSPSEVAKSIGVSGKTISNWIKDPSHPLKAEWLSKRTRRISRENLENFSKQVTEGKIAFQSRESREGGANGEN